MIGTFGNSVADADADTAVLARAISLLAAVGDPQSSKAVLDRLAALLEETKQRAAEAEKAERANGEKLKGLLATEKAHQARDRKLDSISSDLAGHQSRLDVAASALAEREKTLAAREARVSEAEAKLEAADKAFAAKIAAHRRALG